MKYSGTTQNTMIVRFFKSARLFGSRTVALSGVIALCLICLTSCRGDELVIPVEYELLPGVTPDLTANPVGMYLLNEGNMGHNKASIDYIDFREALYIRNLYPERNPHVVKELGDVGNDIQIYGSRMYAVINCSHKVEVMEAATGYRIGQVDIPNCRYIRFHDGMAYVSSYVGTSAGTDSPKGAVYKIDTASLNIVGQVTVGYQPEEMEVIGNTLYVANSGGYRAPDYDSTLSVINLLTFRQTEKIPVGINLHRVKKDRHDRLWVTSRGDFNQIRPALYVLTKKAGTDRMIVTDTLSLSCGGLAIRGDSLFYYSSETYTSGTSRENAYGVVDLISRHLVNECFITDGSQQGITMPYGIALHPTGGDVYITDAKNYVSSGKLHCYSREGTLKWSVRTGDIPAHLVFRNTQP